MRSYNMATAASVTSRSTGALGLELDDDLRSRVDPTTGSLFVSFGAHWREVDVCCIVLHGTAAGLVVTLKYDMGMAE